MSFTLPSGPRGDSPSDKGRRKKAVKKTGAAIKEAGSKPAPKPPTPKPGARSTGRAIEKAGAKAGPPSPKPSPSGDRPSDRPDTNARRKAEVERQRERDERKSAIIAALESSAQAARKPVKKLDESTGLTKLIKDRAKKGPSLEEFAFGRDHSEEFPGKTKRSGVDAAVDSAALKILDETTRVARGVGEGIKASEGDPTDITKWPKVAKAAAKAVVTNKGDMPGDAVVPKDAKGPVADAARLAGNIAGDPLTYVTLGRGAGARASAKVAAKRATKRALKQGATKKAADRAGRAAAKKVVRKRRANNRGVSVGLRATIPFTSRPILDVKTSGRTTAAVSRAVKGPQAGEKVRAKASSPVRKAPGTQAVRPAGRTPESHTRVRRAQRELRAAQDTARREGAEVRRTVKKATKKAKATGVQVYDRIETTPQGVSLGADKTADVARLVREHLGRSFDEKRAAGLADKPFRPRDIETRVQPVVKVVRDKSGKTVAKQTTYKAQLKAGGKWQTVARAGTKKEAEALRKQVHATADEMVKRGELPESDDARRYAPHMRQPQTESVAPVPLASRQTRTNEEKAREIRKPLADANADAASGAKVKRNPDDLKNELFTDDIATTTGLHVQRAGEKTAEAKFWREVAKTGKPLGQVVRSKGGVLDLSQLPKGAMVYRQDERGLHALAKGNSGELDTEAVRRAVKDSGRDGNRFVVLDPQEVERVRDRVFPKAGRSERGDDYAALYDRATGKVKWWLTIPNPSYHIRNLVGDTNLAWLGDANARSMTDAFLVMRGRTAAQKAAARGEKAASAKRTIDLGSKTKGSKRTLTHEELLREAQDVGSISLGQGGKELDDLMHAGGKQTRTLDSGPASTLSRLNMRREDVPRLASHIAARRRGLTPQEAADWVNRHHFDYGDLNRADRGLRRVVPFATWWTRNVPLQAVKLVERPGKHATMAKVLDAAAKQAGFDDYESFASGLNTWQQDGIPVPVRTPWDGRLKVASIGPPQTDLNFHKWVGLMSGEGGDEVAQRMAMDFVSRLNPLIKLPTELTLNHSAFFRGPIDSGQEGQGSSLEPAPDMSAPMREFFGVVKYEDKRDGKVKWGWDKTVAYAVRQSLPLANRAVGIFTPGMSDRNQTSADAIVSFAGVNLTDFEQSVEKAALNRRYDRRNALRGRKRRLEDTQKTKGKEYREVVRELRGLERELAPPRKRARKKSGFRGLLDGGSGSSFRELIGDSTLGGSSVERSSGVNNTRQGQQGKARAHGPVQAQHRQIDRGQHVAQAIPARVAPAARSVPASVRASSVDSGVGSNEPELRSYARRVAEDVDLDPDLFEAQIEAESNFDPNAGSPAGAQGVAQIMPDTAAAWGVDPSNPRAALREAAKRMKGYIDKYDGDVERALAAYNAGEGAVAQHGGVPPYAETRAYIAKIKAKAATLRERGGQSPTSKRRGTVRRRGSRVIGVGDSLGVGTYPHLNLAASSAKEGRSSAAAVKELERLLKDNPGAGRVVFDAGTNDASASALRSSVGKALRLARGATVYVPQVNGPNAAAKNAALRKLADQHGNLRVVEWTGEMAGDGIHLTAAGYKARAAAIRKALGGNPGPAGSEPEASEQGGQFNDAQRARIAGYLLERGRNPQAVSSLAADLAALRTPEPSVAEAADAPAKTGTKSARPRSRGRFTGKGSGGYQGSQGPAEQLMKIGTSLGLTVTNTKRHNTNPYSGKGSDHDHGNTNAFAADLSNGNRPTKEMDQAAFRIARQLGIRDYQFGTPINRKVQIGDVRVQIIYRGSGEAFGGNHMDHVHIGVRRV